ncbi:TIGR02680 family protein [Nocardia bovistercoris]|uniref:TIGR02680 family protein n=1 Tax=Nocardia bovistercoris TaxID=2785916 RepID=A0A931N2K0_9NOCA|nr:TIGR02680 family protein [Nocardia bovistercoris]MBH0776989.1 TIGR02680 family protein [Nocardia bovistercoris]
MTVELVGSHFHGQEWLRAAQSRELPEPGRLRWQPLRVGIVNLWEYDDAEFWFADGRLVLRGGNGAGKTKVLELTTLMLLRGEIAPSVLDPFGSQHRSMRFNLLPTGDGDDPREPADAGLGYAWAEFGRVTESGATAYFTCGLGASARAGSGTATVNTWHFVTRGRVGRDFTLLEAGRARELKDLKQIDAMVLPGSAAAYRARLAEELYGLNAESYDNLTELLKQLRKPKLGERLNPASLATTLRDALPPLASHEVDQLADGWEHLEQLRMTMARTEESAHAIAQFVRSGWQPWARRVLRLRSDEMASSTTSLDRTTSDKKAAEGTLAEAVESRDTAEARLTETRRGVGDATAALRELLESDSYRDAVAAAGRIESLRREYGRVRGQHADLCKAVERELDSESKAERKADAAATRVREAGEELRGVQDSLAENAVPAGLAESARRHLAARDVDALVGDHRSREERFRHLRGLDEKRRAAVRRVEGTGDAVEKAETRSVAAREAEAAALTNVREAAQTLETRVRAWAADVEVAAPTDETLADWCDLIPQLTVIDDTGEAAAHPSVTAEMRHHISARRTEWQDRRQSALLDRAPIARRLEEVDTELARARAETDAAPPLPTTWRRRSRPEVSAGEGAPLWRLVDPAPEVDDTALAVLEAALAGSGLLDAWITPHGAVDFEAADIGTVDPTDGVEAGPNLLMVLQPVEAGGVRVELVRRILARFGWRAEGHPEPEGDWLGADGCWRVGRLAGRAETVGFAAYLGVAARAAARMRRIAALEAERDELTDRLSALDIRIAAAATALDRLAAEERALPESEEREVGLAVVLWGERTRATIASATELAAAAKIHADAVSELDVARAALAEYAAAHNFSQTELDAQADALNAVRRDIDRYRMALRQFAAAEDAHADARVFLEEAVERRVDAESAREVIAEERHRLEVKLRTAESTLDTDQQQQLDRKTGLETRIAHLENERDSYDKKLGAASVAAARAEEVLTNHEEKRAEAEQARDRAIARLWETLDHGLAQSLAMALPERRNVQAARDLATAVRREVDVKAEPADVDRAWRACVNKLEELRQALLPQQDARILDDDETLPRVEIHTDADAGFQLPPAAADTLAERVREQRDSFDAEQQRVLATLLGSTFIEHLKERLDYTRRTFTRINNQLAARPTRQGHTVKVMWEADPTEPDAAAVLNALGQGYAELSVDRQEMVRQYLARKIDEARSEAAADGAADWKHQLGRALDYRGWLKIGLHYRSGSAGRWAPFDAAKHGAKSGGEKVVLLSQPLFAAAVVAYDAAAAHAPRWVWLDEAMTGVDAQVKASFMGLTVDFELDIMLTAHDEWCNYETVPAVAIYELAREKHLPGVDVLPYLWCGGTLTEVDVDRLGSVPASLPTDGLFGLDDG